MTLRARWIAAASAVLVLLIAAAIALVVFPIGGASPAGAPSTDAPPAIRPVTPPTTAPGASATEREAASADLISGVLSVVTVVTGDDTDAVLASLRSVVSDSYLRGIEAERAELDDQGWTRTGSPRIDGIEVLSEDPVSSPTTVTLRACIDSSDVVIHDASGDVVPGGATRAWNIFVLEQTDGAWRIAGQTFADDPAC